MTDKKLVDTWRFRLLYLAGFLVTVAALAATRLLPGRERKRFDESVFAEANRGVLTALGIA